MNKNETRNEKYEEARNIVPRRKVVEEKKKKLRSLVGEEKRNERRVLSSFLFETLTSEDPISRDFP